jgi:alpha-mannosidase
MIIEMQNRGCLKITLRQPLYNFYVFCIQVFEKIIKSIKRGMECDLMENGEKKIRPNGSNIEFEIKPYEIKTFMIKTK